MVDRQIVLDTVKKMLDSGLSDSVIANTLKDVGLKENDIPGFIAQAKGQSLPPVFEKESPPKKTILEQLTQKPAVSSSTPPQDDNALLHTTTHAALESSNSQLQFITQKIGALEQKMGAVSTLPVSELNSRLVAFERKTSTLSSDISELKAQTQALREILEKVLDTNRNILQELENKK